MKVLDRISRSAKAIGETPVIPDGEEEVAAALRVDVWGAFGAPGAVIELYDVVGCDFPLGAILAFEPSPQIAGGLCKLEPRLYLLWHIIL